MSVNEILAYLELHYWVLILVFLGSVLIILRLFYKNLNKENLENLIKKKKSNTTYFDKNSESEETFSSAKKPFEDQFYDNSESSESSESLEVEMESIKQLDKENLFIKTQ